MTPGSGGGASGVAAPGGGGEHGEGAEGEHDRTDSCQRLTAFPPPVAGRVAGTNRLVVVVGALGVIGLPATTEIVTVAGLEVASPSEAV